MQTFLDIIIGFGGIGLFWLGYVALLLVVGGRQRG